MQAFFDFFYILKNENLLSPSFINYLSITYAYQKALKKIRKL